MYLPKIGSVVTVALALMSATVFAQVASAQDAPAPAAPAAVAATAPPSILSVRLPPNARLRLDLDARDEDLLGIVKSFFRGFKGQSLKELLDWMKAGGTTTGTGPGRSIPLGDLEKVAAVQLLSDADLGTMLRDVNHVRIVVFETKNNQRSSDSYDSSTTVIVNPPGGVSITTPKKAVKPPAKPPARQSIVAFYEQAYMGENGRRIMRADFDEVQMLMVGFPGRGFATVVQAPGLGVVVRADGYPNFEGVGPFVMATLLRFAPPQRSQPHFDFDSLRNLVKSLR